MTIIDGDQFIIGLNSSFLFLFLGGIGSFLTVRNFQFFKSYKNNKRAWLINHIGRIVGALIASVTACVIAGLNFQSIIAWLSPTALGVFYIIYWNRKTEKNRMMESVPSQIDYKLAANNYPLSFRFQ